MEVRQEQFDLGRGVPAAPPQPTCADCGYSHPSSKNFRRKGDGYTCSTGHYERDGKLMRARNGYAR